VTFDEARAGVILTDERPLSAILDEHPFAMLAYDENFVVVDVNRAAEKLFEMPRAELLGLGGLDRVHPDDIEMTINGALTTLDDPRRIWPAAVRVMNSRGETVPVIANGQFFSPPIRGVSAVLGLFRADHTYAMDKFVDVLYSAENMTHSLDLAVAAAEATGHYRASIHHTVGFTGVGRFDEIVDNSIGEAVDVHTPVLERLVRDAAQGDVARFMPLPALGLPVEIIHRGSCLHSIEVFPLDVLGAVAGALVVWTEQEEMIGPFGHAYLERIASLIGLGVGQEIERKARSSTRKVGSLMIDLVERTVEMDGRLVKLTPIESTILGMLSEMPGRPVSREGIVQQLFGSTHVGESRAADVHIKNLRLKLGDDPSTQRLIVTMRGVGYALRP
jgi:PAS domain S-box-containing protein